MTVPVSSSNAEKWLPVFANPPREYGPIALWLWNDSLDPAQITHQLQQMSEQGLYTAIIRAWAGLRVPFGSPAWVQGVTFAVTEAARLGMRLWLHAAAPDESAPSSSAPSSSPPQTAE